MDGTAGLLDLADQAGQLFAHGHERMHQAGAVTLAQLQLRAQVAGGDLARQPHRFGRLATQLARQAAADQQCDQQADQRRCQGQPDDQHAAAGIGFARAGGGLGDALFVDGDETLDLHFHRRAQREKLIFHDVHGLLLLALLKGGQHLLAHGQVLGQQGLQLVVGGLFLRRMDERTILVGGAGVASQRGGQARAGILHALRIIGGERTILGQVEGTDLGLHGLGRGDAGHEVGLHFVELCIDGIESVPGRRTEHGHEQDQNGKTQHKLGGNFGLSEIHDIPQGAGLPPLTADEGWMMIPTQAHGLQG